MSELPVVFDQNGLVPVVVQDDQTNAVLMMAFMNRDALNQTRESGKVHFWSRSRQRLWMKGETSGHFQFVHSIHVNCYDNSLLVRVEQVGACCHTGHETCYFRELTPTGDLIETGTRRFDPAEVYGGAKNHSIRIWLGAYQWLAEHDLITVSGTSRLLRTATPAYLAGRASDELREVAGVLTGEHRHLGLAEDLMLEGSQSLYWMALTALRSGLSTGEILSLVAHSVDSVKSLEERELASLLTTAANQWEVANRDSIATLIQETIALLNRAAGTADRSVSGMIEADLAELKSRSYLEPYFTAV